MSSWKFSGLQLDCDVLDHHDAFFGISHIEPADLDANEATALEKFKNDQRKVLVQVLNREQEAGSNLHNANIATSTSPLILAMNSRRAEESSPCKIGRTMRLLWPLFQGHSENRVEFEQWLEVGKTKILVGLSNG